MSLPRRGLLAAGLALAAVTSVGVASTLNAGAAQIEPPPVVTTSTDAAPATATPATATPATATPATATPGPSTPTARRPRTKARRTPPSTLPWGGKPRKARAAGTAGPAADGVAASGATTPGQIPEPVPAYEPKGNPAGGVVTKGVAAGSGATGLTMQALAVPAAPIVNYLYSSARQFAPSDGTYATLTIAKPWLSQRDYHTLAEVAVQSVDGRQVVEVGWTIDRDVNNGSAEPHLFVYHWVDREESCYNACGFVQVSQNVKPGDPLPVGTEKRFAIQHFGTAWWINYDNEWIGYFPDELWNGKFTRGGLTQWFGEVAASTLAPCTDMGNGRDGLTAENAASFSDVNFIKGPLQLDVDYLTTKAFYSVSEFDQEKRKFRFGGKGSC